MVECRGEKRRGTGNLREVHVGKEEEEGGGVTRGRNYLARKRKKTKLERREGKGGKGKLGEGIRLKVEIRGAVRGKKSALRGDKMEKKYWKRSCLEEEKESSEGKL